MGQRIAEDAHAGHDDGCTFGFDYDSWLPGPGSCTEACQQRGREQRRRARAGRWCRLLGHKFTAAHVLLDPSPELFDSCLRCRTPRDTGEPESSRTPTGEVPDDV